jgi:tetratricopeptide (TPR) repeat protein
VLTALDPDTAEDALRGELLLDLGFAYWSSGDRDIARRAFEDAIDVARSIGDAELLTRATIGRGGRRAWTEAGVVDDVLIAFLEEALALLPVGDSPARAMATGRLASELYFRPYEDDRRHRLTEEAMAMARRLGDPHTLAYVLVCARFGLWLPNNVAERAPIGREIVELANTLGNRELEATGWGWRYTDAWELGDIGAVRTAIAKCAEAASELRMPEIDWYATMMDACLALFEGRIDEATPLMERALEYGQRAQTTTALQFYGVQLFATARMRGGLEALEPIFIGMVDEYPLIPAWRCGLVYLYAELGWDEKARRQFDVLAETNFELPFDANWQVGMAILAFAAAMLDDADAARILYERMSPHADLVITVGMPAEVIGTFHLPLARLAATLERWDEFEAHSAAAKAWLVTMGGRPWLARAQYEEGAVLQKRGRPGDSERARELLETSLAASRELGISRLQGLTEALLEP